MNSTRSDTIDDRSTRRGATMALALLCLGVATLMVGSIGKLNYSRRQQSLVNEHVVQTRWLIKSGLTRAVSQLKDDGNYSGEVWMLTADDLSAARSATITIVSNRMENSEIVRVMVLVELNVAGRSVSKMTEHFDVRRPLD